MKKISSKIAAIALLGAITTTGVYAKANAWDTTGGKAQGGTIYGADSNVTLRLGNDWADDTHFTFHIDGGQLPDGGTVLICNDLTLVGTLINDTDPRALIFQINNHGDNNLTREDQNLTFTDGKTFDPLGGGTVSGDLTCADAHRGLTIIPDAVAGGATPTCVTVWTDLGQDQSGNVDIPQMDTAPSHFVAEYREEIMISCTPPICTLNNERTEFLEEMTASGVNLRHHVGVTDLNASRDAAFTSDCYFGGCNDTTALEDINCTTTVMIRNNIVDHNVTGFDLTTSLNGVAGAILANADGARDINITQNGGENNLSVTFTIPAGQTGNPGAVTGTLSNFTSLHSSLVSTAETIATIADVKTTEFTVTYMNPNSKSFAKITAMKKTKLYARVTDQAGLFVDVEFLQGIEAGATAFVFADGSGSHAYDLDALVDAVKPAGFGNGWTVDFQTNTAVDVAAYMQTANGERTLTVLYPEYTGILTKANLTAAAAVAAAATAEGLGLGVSDTLVP